MPRCWEKQRRVLCALSQFPESIQVTSSNIPIILETRKFSFECYWSVIWCVVVIICVYIQFMSFLFDDKFVINSQGVNLWKIARHWKSWNWQMEDNFITKTWVGIHLISKYKAPAKRGHIVAATLCPAMLPTRGKTQQHCCTPHGHKCFWRFSETFFVSRTQNLCWTQMLRA